MLHINSTFTLYLFLLTLPSISTASVSNNGQTSRSNSVFPPLELKRSDFGSIVDVYASNHTENPNSPTIAPALAPENSSDEETLNPPSSAPSKKYEPAPDDNDEQSEEDQDKGPDIWNMICWIAVAFSAVLTLCYFRDVILFFFGTVLLNTRRHGYKGCLRSFFPCLFGSDFGRRRASHGQESLDQVIFESEESGLRRGLVD